MTDSDAARIDEAKERLRGTALAYWSALKVYTPEKELERITAAYNAAWSEAYDLLGAETACRLVNEIELFSVKE